jgi:two-component system OmpR family response regulator
VTRILVVEDEQSFSDPLSYLLRKEGYEVAIAEDGPAALEEFDRVGADLVLLDLMLPGLSGTEVCRQLRTRSTVPVIMLTAKDSEIDKVVGLEIGADDYVTKPFDLRELLARITAILRRTATGEPAVPAVPASPVAAPARRACLVFAGFAFDAAARSLTDAQGQEVSLTTGEFDLLKVFTEHPGRVLSRDFLLEQTRGRGAGPFDRTIDVQVGRLRKKLVDDPDEPKIIKSVRGAGYVLVSEVRAQ